MNQNWPKLIEILILPVSIAGICESIDCYARLWGVERFANSSIQFIIGNWTPKGWVGVKNRLGLPVCKRVQGWGRGSWSSLAAVTMGADGGGVVTPPCAPAQTPSRGGHAWAWRADRLVFVCHVPWWRGFRHRKWGIVRNHAGQLVEWRQLERFERNLKKGD